MPRCDSATPQCLVPMSGCCPALMRGTSVTVPPRTRCSRQRMSETDAATTPVRTTKKGNGAPTAGAMSRPKRTAPTGCSSPSSFRQTPRAAAREPTRAARVSGSSTARVPTGRTRRGRSRSRASPHSGRGARRAVPQPRRGAATRRRRTASTSSAIRTSTPRRMALSRSIPRMPRSPGRRSGSAAFFSESGSISGPESTAVATGSFSLLGADLTDFDFDFGAGAGFGRFLSMAALGAGRRRGGFPNESGLRATPCGWRRLGGEQALSSTATARAPAADCGEP